MRPGFVVRHASADGSSHTDEEELTHADVARERGDDDADDDYIEARRSGTRTSVRIQFIVTASVDHSYRHLWQPPLYRVQ